MTTNNSLDLRALHDQIHNLVLSKRQGIGLWDGVFETAWAGRVLAQHVPENRQEDILNSIKGELLGEKRLTTISKPYDLASAYMIAAFLHQIGAVDDSREFVELAEEFVTSYHGDVTCQERFQFYSTPEYVYAASLTTGYALQVMSPKSIAALQQATTTFQQDNWGRNSYILALAGSAYLCTNGFQPEDCVEIAKFVHTFEPLMPEDNIALLWLLDTHWEQMRRAVSDNELVAEIDHRLLELRTKVFRFYPNYVTEAFDFEQNLSLPENQRLERVAAERVVSTIELLMLDEITERHATSSLVVTRDEWERRDVVVTLLDEYRYRVDEALAQLGLTNHLQAIYQNLRGNNPASWSQAAFGCRQMLYELADKLLQVPDKSYPYIKGHDGKPMSLAKDKEKNRLHAYMHQMGIRSDNPLLARQLDYTVSVMRELIDEAAATGKRSTTYEAACSILLHTYLFLGELVRLTGFQIVTSIVAPNQDDNTKSTRQ